MQGLQSMSEAGKKIIAGLKDALAFARGDRSKGRVTTVKVEECSHDYIRGLKRAAEIASLHADENMRMADDTIKLNPLLNRKKRALIKDYQELARAELLSEKLAIYGCYYEARSHSAKNIADEIRMEIRRA